MTDTWKSDPEAAGMDPVRLARIDEHLRTRYIEAGKLAGCLTVVARRGTVAHFSMLGHADLQRRRRVAEDTIWRIYSMTKPVTGVALMTLYERGAFALTDPVARFLPGWDRPTVRQVEADGTERIVDARRLVQIRDVLTHTAGLGYTLSNRDLDLGDPGTTGRTASIHRAPSLAELVDRLAQAPLRFQPGTHWLYSFGIDVCARLVEVIAGMPFDEYLRREIFEPLGMVDTGFFVPDAAADRFAATYARTPAKELVCVDEPTTSEYRSAPSFLSGGGGLVSTAPDYLRFALMLANGGELDGWRILSRKTVELMTVNHLEGGATMADLALPGSYGETGFDGMGFGLTMAVNQGPAATAAVGSAGTFSWGGAASTTFWVDPVEDLVVVFMTQFMPSGTFNFRGQLGSIVYGAISD